jgi:hypothetical protein
VGAGQVGEGDRTLYQEGDLSKIRPLGELAAASPFAAGPDRLRPGTANDVRNAEVMSGGVRAARHFRM